MMDLIAQQLLNGIILGGMYSICATGMALIFGMMELPNFAHGQIYMMAGYTVYAIYSATGTNPIIAMALGSIAFLGVGALMRISIFYDIRTMPLMDGTILSMGLATALEGLSLLVFGPDWRNIPTVIKGVLVMGNIRVSWERMFVFFVSMVVLTVLWIVLKRTKLGKAMRATQQNRDVAETLGVNIERIYTITFAIGLFLVSIAAAVLLPILCVDPFSGRPITLKSFAVVVFGGMGSVKGAMVCGLILGIVEALGGLLISYRYMDLISYSVMILTIMLKPKGLFGLY